MRSNVTLNNGRIVTHKPMPNGSTEAYMLDNGMMSNDEWLEYVSIINPKTETKKKPTWAEIVSSRKGQYI
jgi:hypothetical protein